MTGRIYVDVDDILCETAVALSELAEREFGRHVAYADIREFNLQNVFRMTDDEMTRFYERSHSPDVLSRYLPVPGAVAGVRRLRDAGLAVDILTGRPASCHRATREWLDGAGLNDFEVAYVDKYGRYRGRRPGDPETLSLAELLARRYDFAIDDSPVILESLKAWGRTRILVFDRPWNRNYRLGRTMVRVGGWDDVIAECLGA